MSPLFVFVSAVSAALGLSFLCSISEATLLSVRPSDAASLATNGAGRALGQLKHKRDRSVAAILVLNTLAQTIGAIVAGASYRAAVSASGLWLFSLLFPAAFLVFSEIIPKSLGLAYATRLARPVSYFVSGLVWALRPVLLLTSALGRAILRGRDKRPATSMDEMRLLARLGRSEGSLGPHVAQFIEGAASLRELTVRDVMVPRGGVAFLSGARSLVDNLEIIRTSKHSRFPFTPSGALDDVSGMVLSKDLLFKSRDGMQDNDWASLVTPLLVVPETTPLEQVLRLFQEQRKHLAVVVDEYGGTQGVVTLEDVLEEIVGEIEDETDRVEQLIVKRPDGRLICRGWAETRKLFRLLSIEQKVDVVTLSGFLADLLGRVPKVEDAVVWNGYRFRVLKARTRRAERVEVVAVTGVPSGPESSGPSASA